jgi:NAD(P)-dependent dehydrogenase (short-subunit alcohol dehydrogenase family)
MIVLVSGAAGGIGRTVVLKVARAGAVVLACDRPGSSWKALDKAWLSDEQLSADEATQPLERIELDLSSLQGARAFVDEAARRFGRVDGLVNIAGYWQTKPFLDITPDQLDEMLDANLKTAFYPAQAVVPLMLKQGRGRIVHFASTAGEYGSISPGSHYAAAKGAVIGLTKSMAREVSIHGILVNAISPGPIDTTALSGGAMLDIGVASQRTLLGRLGEPAEVAEVVVFLLSEAASFITGQIIGVNGGSRL